MGFLVRSFSKSIIRVAERRRGKKCLTTEQRRKSSEQVSPSRTLKVSGRLRFALPDRVVEGVVGRAEPARQRHLAAGVKVDSLDSLDVQVAEERLVPASEWETSHGRRNANVDADHAGVEMLLELTRCVPAAREDGSAVTTES